jgi:hypothetical protein
VRCQTTLTIPLFSSDFFLLRDFFSVTFLMNNILASLFENENFVHIKKWKSPCHYNYIQHLMHIKITNII